MHQLPKLKLEKGLIHGFSSISDGNLSFLWGGEDDVLNNRRRFLEKSDIDPNKCAVMSILDSDNIIPIDSSSDTGIEKDARVRADALITSDKNVFLFLLTGDCLPIIFFDPLRYVVALAHCSWKSTDTKLSEKVVNFMKDKYKTNSADLIVGIGPGIHKESYIQETIDHRQEQSSEWSKFIKKFPDGRIRIDLVGYNISQLINVGVKEENIEVSPIDTAKDSDFFSHYRAQRTGEKEGRFATIIGMK
ncbi:MAG: polyphenol oxidase family protein [Minisyncoccia bacterium]